MKATLRFLTLVVCSLVSFAAGATDYSFTGDGDWTVSSNWAGGLVPPAPLSPGSSVFIHGNAVVNTTCTNCSANSLLNNGGTIVVVAGGSLTLPNLTQLTHIGSLIVNGTLINKTLLEIFTGSTVIINGKLLNQKQISNSGTITVENGGRLENQLTALFVCLSAPAGTGSLVVNNGGTIVNKNSAVLMPGNMVNHGIVENGSTMSGNAVVNGNLVNSGTIAPGNSIGSYVVTGNYTASSSSFQNFEVGGMEADAYDKLIVNGSVKLDGVLNVTLANGFIPNADHDLPIITGAINGTFSSVFKPSKYLVVYNSHSVVLRYNVSLPMVYIKLNVKKENNSAKLSWEIHNEPSAVRYEIERSADGRAYSRIAIVNAVQSGKYDYIDHQPKDKNFYRIKVIDVGGTYRYSSVVSLQQGKTGIALNVYPSPVQKDITIQHASAAPNSKLLITSLDGRIIKLFAPQIESQQTLVDVSLLNAGTYVMQFQNGTSKTEAIMFAKQ